MKFVCLVLLLGLLLPDFLRAQPPVFVRRNSVRLGVDLTSLDGPDDVGPRFVGRLARHIGNDRVVIAAEVGYMRISSATQPFNNVDPGPNTRERFTADATVLYDFLPQPDHALRAGVGVSAWYRREDIYRGASAVFGPSGLQGVAIDRVERNGLNTGIHFAVEYEWLFDPRWGIDARLRLANLKGAGISSILGAGITHRF